jgi:hypothetical protein
VLVRRGDGGHRGGGGHEVTNEGSQEKQKEELEKQGERHEAQAAAPEELPVNLLIPTYVTNDDKARILYVEQLQETVVRNREYWEGEVKQIARKRNAVFAGGIAAIIIGIVCVAAGIVLILRDSHAYGIFSTSAGALISVGLAPLYRFERRLMDEKKIAMKSIEQQTNIVQVTGIAVMTSPDQRERILGDLAAKLIGLIGSEDPDH